ncbi:hypothetical protein MASR1M107_27420 [Ignavibacteriales bacterium]
MPSAPTKNDTITVTITKAVQGAKLHWGVNPQGSNWTTPNQAYWPAGTSLFGGSGPAVETVMSGPSTDSLLTIKIGPFNNSAQTVDGVAFVIHYNDNTWNNNNGQDFKINFGGGSGGSNFVMDGTHSTSRLSALVRTMEQISTSAGTMAIYMSPLRQLRLKARMFSY